MRQPDSRPCDRACLLHGEFEARCIETRGIETRDDRSHREVHCEARQPAKGSRVRHREAAEDYLQAGVYTCQSNRGNHCSHGQESVGEKSNNKFDRGCFQRGANFVTRVYELYREPAPGI